MVSRMNVTCFVFAKYIYVCSVFLGFAKYVLYNFCACQICYVSFVVFAKYVLFFVLAKYVLFFVFAKYVLFVCVCQICPFFVFAKYVLFYVLCLPNMLCFIFCVCQICSVFLCLPNMFCFIFCACQNTTHKWFRYSVCIKLPRNWVVQCGCCGVHTPVWCPYRSKHGQAFPYREGERPMAGTTFCNPLFIACHLSLKRNHRAARVAPCGGQPHQLTKH